MGRHAGRAGAAWERARSEVLRGASVCALCGGPLDFEAPARSRWAPSVDHVMSLAKMRGMDEATQVRLALDPANLRPAHYGCNSARGAGRRPAPQAASRRW